VKESLPCLLLARLRIRLSKFTVFFNEIVINPGYLYTLTIISCRNGEDPSKAAVAPASNGAAAYDQYAYNQQYNQYGNYANWNYQQSSGHGYNQQGWNAYQGYYG
jgi:hypothetical protein